MNPLNENLFALLIPILTAFGSQGNDVLDGVDTAVYWEIAGIEQKVEALVPFLTKEVEDKTRLQKLMAIRTLGELKEEEAIPLLEALLDSKEHFVSDYARRALARIQGEAFSPEQPESGNLQEDLSILPTRLDLLLNMQAVARQGQANVRKVIFDGLEVLEKLNPGMGVPKPGDFLKYRNDRVIGVYQKIGNMRVDSITATASEDVFNLQGGVSLAIRGLFDHQRVAKFLLEDLKFEETEVDGLTWLKGFDGSFWVHLHSNELAVAVYRIGETETPFLKSIGKRLSGKDKSPVEGNVMDMVSAAPENPRMIFAFHIPGPREEGLTTTLTFKGVYICLSRREKEDGGYKLEAALDYSQEALARSLETEYKTQLAMAAGAFEGLALAEKRLKQFGDILKTVKIERDGTTLKGEAHIAHLDDLSTWLMMISTVRAMESAKGPDAHPTLPADPTP